jgi:hypothetical protein
VIEEYKEIVSWFYEGNFPMHNEFYIIFSSKTIALWDIPFVKGLRQELIGGNKRRMKND